MRVAICPQSATGLSGVMLTLVAPTCKVAADAEVTLNIADRPTAEHKDEVR